jgi:hypothetical protein
LNYLTEYQEPAAGLLIQQSKLKEAAAAVAALKETRERTAAEFRRTLYDELAKAEQKAAGIAQDVIKAERRTSSRISSPRRRHRPAACRAYGGRRRHASPGARRGGPTA